MFNSAVFNNLQEFFLNNKNSHSYIFYTNNFELCQNDVYKLVKKIFNVNSINLISSDFIVVSKTDKKNILKDDMSDLRNFFQKTSYLNDKRVYLIEEAHKLNSTTANMILKFLEEPLKGVIAFFITTNLDSVLSTIKSRCQIVNCFYEQSTDVNIDYKELVDNIFINNPYENLFNLKKVFDKFDRSELINIFNDYLNFYYLNFDVKYKNRIFVVNKAINMLNNNVNVDYIIDYISIEGGNEK